MNREVSGYPAWFKQATARFSPYPYQQQLAEQPWPDALEIPTGLGKTAAVTLAWLYKRRKLHDPETPRRLVWCLPMRVLVEQTRENIQHWLTRLDEPVPVHLLMGGEADMKAWSEEPEQDQILIGTQDMLLSRALMRGYGMSRYRWPIDFAQLHSDALWVFDEIQLMGAGLPTSTQLEAFRRTSAHPGSARSLWISATLNAKWMDSIDFRPYLDKLRIQTLSNTEKHSDTIRKRHEANKPLAFATTRLTSETAKSQAKTYIHQLCDEILQHHENQTTLIILNTVERAQALGEQLLKRFKKHTDAPEMLLVHSRFRAEERQRLNQRLARTASHENRIIIATQAIEAGVDLSSHILFTELAPWPSLVQRFGRCNRAGEHALAPVFILDIETGKKLSPPYTDETLEAAHQKLNGLTSASAADLPRIDEARPIHPVLRRKDLLELFNTEADLSGFDIDISPYIRDSGTPPIQVFWRNFDKKPEGQMAPKRNELCPVSITQIQAHLKKAGAYTWDIISRDWQSQLARQVRPGQTLLLRASEGGYSPLLGFRPRFIDKKKPLQPLEGGKQIPESDSDDPDTLIGCFIPLDRHLHDVAKAARVLCEALHETEQADAIECAARWHDVGKAHEAFQNMLIAWHPNATAYNDRYWAKSDGTLLPDSPRWPDYVACGGDAPRLQIRRGFRHELASALAWLAHHPSNESNDLIAYLIAAHHGKVRMGLRALPNEEPPTDGRAHARGVWEGDQLPELYFDGEHLPKTKLRLDIMALGEGESGASWATRTQKLLHDHGPFRLAWLEMLVRIADWRASREEQQ